ncbi:hypothetical protein [Xanthomonas bonasiae]|uniref:hypothetical protein n=1 Tax=Xanthomonas bonasiae TaxID=2810351 RepID=UPI00197F7E8D|nr:hypothetical protein [Xanthomonas bonasiae]MBN6110583.1 hypothetical protein [Xanthomonas bonasiae]
MIKIYLACGLTHVPRCEFAAYVILLQNLAAHLKDRHGAEVKYALRDSDPQLGQKRFSDRARLCYAWDKEMVEWADLVIAEASFPSTGLGIELQIACARNTPIIVAFKLDEGHKAQPVDYRTPDQDLHSLQLGEGYVSLMALGLPTIAKVLSYGNDADALAKVGAAIDAYR